MSRFNSKLSLLVMVGGLAASPVSTFADSFGFEQPPTRVVRFGDLDLTRSAGVEKLYSRIKSAARDVCEPDDISIKLLRMRHDCRQDAVARAIAEVNSPALTDYFLDKGKNKNLAANQTP